MAGAAAGQVRIADRAGLLTTALNAAVICCCAHSDRGSPGGWLAPGGAPSSSPCGWGLKQPEYRMLAVVSSGVELVDQDRVQVRVGHQAHRRAGQRQQREQARDQPGAQRQAPPATARPGREAAASP
ncbi:MAG: hypothetical protein ACRDOK_18700 [Streptosporangiaceae bacterium]